MQRPESCRRQMHYPEKLTFAFAHCAFLLSRPARQGYSDGSNNSALLATPASARVSSHRFDARAASTVQAVRAGRANSFLIRY